MNMIKFCSWYGVHISIRYIGSMVIVVHTVLVIAHHMKFGYYIMVVISVPYNTIVSKGNTIQFEISSAFLWYFDLGEICSTILALPSISYFPSHYNYALNLKQKFKICLSLFQTPPAIPTLFVAVLSSILRGSKLIVDYHNYGHTLMAMSLGKKHFMVQLAKLWEHEELQGFVDLFIVSELLTYKYFGVRIPMRLVVVHFSNIQKITLIWHLQITYVWGLL